MNEIRKPNLAPRPQSEEARAIGKAFACYQRYAGLSNKDMGALTGFSAASINSIRAGHFTPTRSTMRERGVADKMAQGNEAAWRLYGRPIRDYLGLVDEALDGPFTQSAINKRVRESMMRCVQRVALSCYDVAAELKMPAFFFDPNTTALPEFLAPPPPEVFLARGIPAFLEKLDPEAWREHGGPIRDYVEGKLRPVQESLEMPEMTGAPVSPMAKRDGQTDALAPYSQDAMILAQAFKKVFSHHGKSQNQAMRIMNLSATTITGLFTGKRTPSRAMLIAKDSINRMRQICGEGFRLFGGPILAFMEGRSLRQAIIEQKPFEEVSPKPIVLQKPPEQKEEDVSSFDEACEPFGEKTGLGADFLDRDEGISMTFALTLSEEEKASFARLYPEAFDKYAKRSAPAGRGPQRRNAAKPERPVSKTRSSGRDPQ